MTRLVKHRSCRSLALLALAVVPAVACDSPTDTPPPAGQPPVAYVEITTQFGLLLAGESIALQARLLSAEGTALNRAVAWVSRDTAVAAITAAGVLTARAAGTAEVTATSEGVQASVTVSVHEAQETPAAPSIEIRGPQGGLMVGETFGLTAIVRDREGVITDQPVTWSSSNQTVAVVAFDGTLTAVGLGTSRITAAAGDHEVRTDIVVHSLPALATALLPAAVQAGSPGIELTIRGTGFAPGATVRYAGQLRPARVVSTTEIRIDLDADDLTYAGGGEVRVLNPGQTLGTTLFFTIERVPATRIYELLGGHYDLAPQLPVRIDRWWELNDDWSGTWYQRRVTAGVLRIHEPPTGRDQWDLTITMSVVRESDGAVMSEENVLFHGWVESHAPSPEMVLRNALFPDVVLHTLRTFNDYLVVWQTLHPSGDALHENAWRYVRKQ